ncbi:hypothetical protein ANN_22907 [Periplaneta americana]|uniref:Uncharacterized protein n=1 Tax=Periplaneta americana TaxID=6978 RepID=A0ABQ8SK20_PERAM|nr:hypothetical protein ANN_22907 [Periplaneta americana]
MSPGSTTESYPAFAHIGLRENPGKNLNQVTCPDRESNPGHLVSRPDALTVTPQVEEGKSQDCLAAGPQQLIERLSAGSSVRNTFPWQRVSETDSSLLFQKSLAERGPDLRRLRSSSSDAIRLARDTRPGPRMCSYHLTAKLFLSRRTDSIDEEAAE